MKRRIKDIIETLKRLPIPEYEGQVLSVPVLTSIEDYVILDDEEYQHVPVSLMVVMAEEFRQGSKSWLEWTYDL